MNSRQRDVLNVLHNHGRSGAYAYHIANSIGAPEPSVRRTVRELRTAGWNITQSGNGFPYRLSSQHAAEFSNGQTVPSAQR